MKKKCEELEIQLHVNFNKNIFFRNHHHIKQVISKYANKMKV